MSATIVWFVALAVVTGLAFTFGRWLGSGSRQRAWMALGLGFMGLGLWAWLMRHPVVAVHMIPLSLLAHIEGTGAAPMFMLVLGVVFALAQRPRQRRVVYFAIGLGGLYFVNGGLWMLQTTPASVLGNSVQGRVVLQTQDYSCVPAACATALNRLGYPSSEAEMALMTQTRPGTGATVIRALEGLRQRLAGTGVRPELVQPTYEELTAAPMPAVTALQFEATRRHMVVLERVAAKGVLLADPEIGEYFLDRPDFAKVYTGQAIIFRRTR